MDMKWIIPLAALAVLGGCGESSNMPLAGDITDINVSSDGNVTSFYATQKVQMTATASYTNDVPDRDVTQYVTWSSSDTNKASVTEVGLVSGGSTGGDVEITGSYKSFASSMILTVHALTSIEINATDANLSNVTQEQTLHLRAEGTFDDNATLDVSDSVRWILGNAGDSNATLDQNGTLYTGDANGTLDINVSRYDINASLEINITL